MMRIYKSNKYLSMICRISQKPRNDRILKTVKFLFLLSIYLKTKANEGNNQKIIQVTPSYLEL